MTFREKNNLFYEKYLYKGELIMKKLLNNYEDNFINYMQRTIKNKLVSLGLIILGLASVPVVEEGTFLLLTILMGLALFLAKDDIFEMR